jgi:hypothetical protein
MQWLWSANAIKCHSVFGMVGAIFISLCLGSEKEMQKFLPGNDRIWMLLFLVIGYPFVLFLLWIEHRNAQRQFAREVVARLNEPQKVKVRRLTWRRYSLVAFAAAGGALIYFGKTGLRIDGFPAQYLGYILLGFAGLGACGVNIWYNGPIDPRFDPEIEKPAEPQTLENGMPD